MESGWCSLFLQGSVKKAKIDTFILLTALRLRSERESSSSMQGKKLARLASFKIRVPLWEQCWKKEPIVTYIDLQQFYQCLTKTIFTMQSFGV